MFFAVAPYTRDLTCPCRDCGDPTLPEDGPSEFYMVRDELWALAGAGDRYLCIGCLEGRLGRRLAREDFSDVRLNDVRYGGGSSGRLLIRLLVPRDALT